MRPGQASKTLRSEAASPSRAASRRRQLPRGRTTGRSTHARRGVPAATTTFVQHHDASKSPDWHPPIRCFPCELRRERFSRERSGSAEAILITRCPLNKRDKVAQPRRSCETRQRHSRRPHQGVASRQERERRDGRRTLTTTLVQHHDASKSPDWHLPSRCFPCELPRERFSREWSGSAEAILMSKCALNDWDKLEQPRRSCGAQQRRRRGLHQNAARREERERKKRSRTTELVRKEAEARTRRGNATREEANRRDEARKGTSRWNAVAGGKTSAVTAAPCQKRDRITTSCRFNSCEREQLREGKVKRENATGKRNKR